MYTSGCFFCITSLVVTGLAHLFGAMLFIKMIALKPFGQTVLYLFQQVHLIVRLFLLCFSQLVFIHLG
jgi:hypothetical protein